MAEVVTERASEVFGKRLKAVRNHRDLTQQELAERMTAAGIPMSKTTLVRIEKGAGERGLSLDEALAFAAVLPASPTHMLTPERDVQIALTSEHRTDASRIRDWLRTGAVSHSVSGEGFDLGRPDTALRERFEQQMARRAETLLDAYRGGDKAGTEDALSAIFAAVDEHRAAKEASDDA